jgi:Arc/MetJ-type ribon-helix-helix transcriptional regulator
MSQINLNVTPDFEARLARLMRRRGFATKSDAIRAAVAEALEREEGDAARTDFATWLGLGNQALRKRKLRFPTDDDLWR